MRRWILVSIACATLALAQPLWGAEWIWSAASRQAGQSTLLRKDFTVESGLQRAELRTVAEYSSLHVTLNGNLIIQEESYAPAAQVDVSRLLKPGRNELAVGGDAVDGPAALALRLDLTFATGVRQSIESDASWRGETAPAATFGAVEEEMWSDPASDTGVHDVDDYTQWTQALGADRSADPASFHVPDGFEIELLRSAQPEEGSWVSMEFDPQGRLIVAREDQGLLRMTLPPGNGPIQVESINDTLLECRGLIFAHGSLYVNANNSKALYRLRDTTGDDRFDEVKRLYASSGGVGHGRNDLALGPEGMIYAIHGDSVDLPRGFADRTSPFREHRLGKSTREGHVLRFDRNGERGEIVAAGLRNPYGIDFSPDGEPFTYDADAEFDMGSPWYRPTRIVPLVSGADFGWRGVTGSWPPYYPDHPDNAPPTIDIGKGSPTAVKFGTQSNFPSSQRRALFVLDWAYGRILAVRFVPHGAGHRARAETFLKGRPLNVTDLGFGPDGAMYFVTGGRKTKAGLYRVRYVGPPLDEPPSTPQQMARERHTAQARAVRTKLEAFHGRQHEQALDAAWEFLDHPDPTLRHAARIAIEHQPVATWQDRALSEPRPMAAATALMALARSPKAELRPSILARLMELPLSELSPTQLEIALHACSLCLSEPQALDEALRDDLRDRLAPLFPHSVPRMNWALSRLLILLDAPEALPATLELLRIASDQQERMHYLFVLRDAQAGWTSQGRKDYFLALRQMRQFIGGEGMPKFIRQIEADALAGLADAERAELAPLLAEEPAEEDDASVPRPLVQAWRLDDLLESLPELDKGRSFERGQDLFTAALCARCHRVGHLGAAIGPDLTSVGSRFSRRDILQSILAPSDVVAEQYRQAQIVTTDGRALVGQIIPTQDYRSASLLIATDPLRPSRVTEIAKSEIQSHTTSPVSVMPEGLLNPLTREEILDLLAWLEAGGDPRHPHYR